MKRISFLTVVLCLGIGLIATTGYADSDPIPPGVNEEQDPYEMVAPNGWSCEGDICSTDSGVTIINIKERQTLFAQKAVFNRKTEIVELSGRIRLEREGDILTAESGTFNLQTKTGQISNGHLFLKQNNYHLSGSSIEKTGENTYVVRDCRVTTCDTEKPAWSITGSEVRVTVEGYGTIKNAAFRVKDVPVLYVPYFIFPAKTKRQTGLLPPSIGHSDLTGMEFELPFFWALSDQTDATFYERWLEKRGLMQGLEFRYVGAGESKGLVLLDYLHDRIPQKELNNPEQLNLSPEARINTNRYWLRSRIDQLFSEALQARLDLDLVSDQDYLREFKSSSEHTARPDLTDWAARPLEESHAPTRRSALRLGLDDSEYSLQASAAYYQRPEHLAYENNPHPIGGLYYSLLPRPIADWPVFIELDGQYNYIFREEGFEGHRLALAPKISYPMWVAPYLEFESSLRLLNTTQWFHDQDADATQQSKSAYHFQSNLATSLERQYDLGGEHAVRLKHKISPTLTYDYRDYHDQGSFQPWFESIDAEAGLNRMTFALKNFLDGRHTGKNGQIVYRQWATFELSQAYNFLEARRNDVAGETLRPFEPLRAYLTLSPSDNHNVSADTYWNHYEKEVTKYNLALDLALNRRGGLKDSLHVDYLYDRTGDQNLNYSLKYNVLSGFSMGHSLKYNLKTDQADEKSYWADYMLQCWGMRLTYSETDSNRSVMLMFHLLGLGDIGSQ
ncbi:MAG: LPS-assembly protein LptD [Desulfobacteraceae bacterium]|nr:MAG: LPS-assembly protein LptD [Desulfobacteraceae bacterium]